MARAATTKRRVTPSTATRRVQRTGPSRRGSSRGGSAPRATRASVLASGGTRRRRGGLICRLVRGLLLFRLRLGIAVGAGCGLLGALLVAVVCGVEARALEGDADRLEDLADRGAALDARGQGVFRHLLHHVEDVIVLALVLVDRHPASI